MNDIFIARQAIYNSSLDVTAYEILYRRGNVATADVVDGDKATFDVLTNAFMEIGVNRLIGKEKGFINFTRNLVLNGHVSLPKDRIVLEILEDIVPDRSIVRSISKLKKQGYTIALDDVTNIEDIKPLICFADIVKIDLIAIDRIKLKEIVSFFKNSKIMLLAEKVETYDDFSECKDMGFDYFQGYFLCRPKTVQAKKLPESRLALLRILSELHNQDVSFNKIETLIKSDVSLSYKLLKIINSIYYSLPNNISSLKQALTLLGINEVKNWISMYLFSKMGDMPTELMRISAIRAKMCELLAKLFNYSEAESFFTVGLFSLLDAMLNMRMEQALSNLSLSEKIVAAILKHEGNMGKILEISICFEKADWDGLNHDLVANGLSMESIENIYLKSIEWSNEIISQ